MQVQNLSLDQLRPPVVIMRDDMDIDKLRELVADIKANGLEQPIIVTPFEDKYRVVAGWRRKLAAEQAGLLEVPCVIKEVDEAGEIWTMLRENLHREDPNPLDEGKMYAVAHEGLHMTVEGIALHVSKSPAYVRNRLALVRGPEDVREAVRAGQITFSVALEILRCNDERDRQYVLYHAALGGCTTDLARRWVDERNVARAAGQTGAAPTDAPTAGGTPATLQGRCDWHMGQVPLDGTLSFQLCGECYQWLTNRRDELLREASATEGGATHVAGA